MTENCKITTEEEENGLFEEFVDLTVRRDRLKKTCELLWIDYIKEFGDLIEENFKAQIEAIKAKKTIAYCQRLKNFGIPVLKVELENYLATTLDDYYAQLDYIRKVKDEPTSTVSEYEFYYVKKIYKRIAKLVHPDIHPDAFRIEGVKELWEKAKTAYECNDLKGLKEAEAVIADLIGKHSGERIAVDIPEIEQKIAELEDEIREIISTDPYKFKYLLGDEELMEEKRQSLRESIEDTRKYVRELQEIIEQFEITEVIN